MINPESGLTRRGNIMIWAAGSRLSGFLYRFKAFSHSLDRIVQLTVFNPGTAAIVLKTFPVLKFHRLLMQGW